MYMAWNQTNQANPLFDSEEWNVALQDMWAQARQGSPSEVTEWLEEAIELSWEIVTGGSGVRTSDDVPWDLFTDALTDEQLSVIKLKVLQDPEISRFIQEYNLAMWNELESAILGEIERRTAPVPAPASPNGETAPPTNGAAAASTNGNGTAKGMNMGLVLGIGAAALGLVFLITRVK